MSQNIEPREEHSDVNFLEYLDLLWKHRKLILIAGFVGAIASLFLYYFTTPLYKSTAKIKLAPMQTSALQYGDATRSYVGAFYFREEYKNTEMQIMTSRAITEKVLEALGPEFLAQHFPLEKSTSLFSFLKGDDEGEPDAAQKAEKIRKRARGTLRRNIRIDEIKETNLFKISFISPNPEAARVVADTWAHTYIQFGKEEELKRNRESLNFVTKSLEELERSTEKLVSEKAYLEAQLDVQLGSNASVGEETVTSLNQTLLDLQTDLIEAKNKLNNLESATPADSIEVGRDPEVLAINKNLLDMRADYEKSEQTLGPKLLEGKRQEIAQAVASLSRAQAKVYRKVLEAQRNVVAIKQRNMEQHKARLSAAEKGFKESNSELQKNIANIAATINVNRQYIEDLNNRRKSYDLAIGLNDIDRTDKVVVEDAYPPGGPFAPSLRKYFAVGLALGLLLAIIFIFLLESIDSKIHTADQLEKVTGLPTLAMVPRVKDVHLQKATNDFKLATFRQIAELAEKAPVGKSGQAELVQIKAIATKAARGETTQGGPDQINDLQAKDFGKIATLAHSIVKTDVIPEIREILFKARYVRHLNTKNIETSNKTPGRQTAQDKSSLASRSASRFLPNAKRTEDEDVAYGEIKTDHLFGMRKVVGCYTHIKPLSPFSESYRHLRTNIQLSDTKEKQIFLLTSSIPGEGKTISSINLAIAFSQLKKKVLLIDGDLRRSKLHKVFSLNNDPGIVNFLVNQAPLDKCLQFTFIEHLHLISAGTTPPNPAELLASDKMKELMSKLREHYDFVIIDSSPVLAVTDACILGDMVDATLFVTKSGHSDRNELARALNILRANNIKPLGTLFNDFDIGARKYGYGRRYGYNYGYGYSYGYSQEPRNT